MHATTINLTAVVNASIIPSVPCIPNRDISFQPAKGEDRSPRSYLLCMLEKMAGLNDKLFSTSDPLVKVVLDDVCIKSPDSARNIINVLGQKYEVELTTDGYIAAPLLKGAAEGKSLRLKFPAVLHPVAITGRVNRKISYDAVLDATVIPNQLSSKYAAYGPFHDFLEKSVKTADTLYADMPMHNFEASK